MKKAPKTVYRKAGRKTHLPAQIAQTPVCGACRPVRRAFNAECENVRRLPIHTYILGGLSGFEWSDEELLRFVCLSIYRSEYMLAPLARKIKHPMSRGAFAEMVYVGSHLGGKVEEEEPLTFPIHFGFLGGISAGHKVNASELLEVFAPSLYTNRDLIQEAVEKDKEACPDSFSADMAEVIVVAEAVLERFGWTTDLDRHAGTVQDPTPAIREAWEAKAWMLTQLISDRLAGKKGGRR
jgi:hypothetical protein